MLRGLYGVYGLGCRAWDLGFRVLGSKMLGGGFTARRALSLGLRVWGLGFRA